MSIVWSEITSDSADNVLASEYNNTKLVEGNMLWNSSFEMSAHGWATYPQYLKTKIITTDYYHGASCLKVQEKQSSGEYNTWRREQAPPSYPNVWVWPFSIESVFYSVGAGRPYTFSFYGKADADGTQVTFTIQSGYEYGWYPGTYSNRSGISKTFTLTTAWVRYSMSFRAFWDGSQIYEEDPSGGDGGSGDRNATTYLSNPAITIRFSAPAAGSGETFYLDALQFEEAGLTSYIPKPLDGCLEVGSDDDVGDHIFDETESIQVTSKVYSADSTKRDLAYTYTIYDYNGDVVSTSSLTRSVCNQMPVLHTYSVPTLDYGLYRIALSVTDSTNSQSISYPEATFLIVPSTNEALTDTRVGDDNWIQSFLPYKKKLGIKWLRSQQGLDIVNWESVEPTDNAWAWDEPGGYWGDDLLTYIAAQGFTVIGTVGMLGSRIPDWAQVPEETFSFKFDRDAFVDTGGGGNDYITNVVTHFQANIKYWEILNEPYGRAITGGNLNANWETVATDYAELLKDCYTVIKGIDSNLKVIGLCTFLNRDVSSAYLKWTERVLQVYGTQYMDYISIHGYMRWLNNEYYETRKGILQELNDMMEYYGGGVKPIFDTEFTVNGGTFHSSNYVIDGYKGNTEWQSSAGVLGSGVLGAAPWYTDGRMAAAWIIQHNVIGARYGVERDFYFNGLEPSWSAKCITDKDGMFEYNGSVRPLGAAMASLSRFLSGTTYNGFVSIRSDIDCHVFDSSPVAVIFGMQTTSSTLSFTPPDGITISTYYPDGRRISASANTVTVNIHPKFIVPSGGTVSQLYDMLDNATLS